MQPVWWLIGFGVVRRLLSKCPKNVCTLQGRSKRLVRDRSVYFGCCDARMAQQTLHNPSVYTQYERTVCQPNRAQGSGADCGYAMTPDQRLEWAQMMQQLGTQAGADRQRHSHRHEQDAGSQRCHSLQLLKKQAEYKDEIIDADIVEKADTSATCPQRSPKERSTPPML